MKVVKNGDGLYVATMSRAELLTLTLTIGNTSDDDVMEYVTTAEDDRIPMRDDTPESGFPIYEELVGALRADDN